jgi:hypothetical protein
MRVWTTETRVWVRNGLREPRIRFSVQTFEDPYPAVKMRGHATVATAHDATTVSRLGRSRAATSPLMTLTGYVARWSDLRTIVTVFPDRIVS